MFICQGRCFNCLKRTFTVYVDLHILSVKKKHNPHISDESAKSEPEVEINETVVSSVN